MTETNPRVHGLGGVFFKSENPEQLTQWYAKHLGVGTAGWGGEQFFWRREDSDQRGYTVWSPFKASTEYFQPSGKDFMINYRVDDLAATLAALRAEGCNVLERYEETEQGKFGYVLDPEGNLLELWEQNPNDPSLDAAW